VTVGVAEFVVLTVEILRDPSPGRSGGRFRHACTLAFASSVENDETSDGDGRWDEERCIPRVVGWGGARRGVWIP
jgi:hypothetical protein